MGTTNINQLRYADTGDVPNLSTITQNLATDVDTRLVPRFVSTAARDATITAPVRGMVCTVCASNGARVYTYAYNGSAWADVSPDPAKIAGSRAIIGAGSAPIGTFDSTKQIKCYVGYTIPTTTSTGLFDITL